MIGREVGSLANIITSLQEILDSGRDNTLAVALFDLDGFHACCRPRGYRHESLYLSTVMTHIIRQLPSSALTFLLPRDSFVSLLLGSDVDLPAVEAARAAAAATSFQLGDIHYQLGASAGVAVFPRDGSTAIDLMRAAEVALDSAKRNGRGRTQLYGGEKMVLKTSYFLPSQLRRLNEMSRSLNKSEAFLLREALDDILRKYDDYTGTLTRTADD